jgi:hypothetical protein
LAVEDPSKIADRDVEAAIAEIGARLASARLGRSISPEDITGLTRKLTDDERVAVAEMAAGRQRALIAELVAGLDQIHIVEALILVRGLLKPLQPFADRTLQAAGLSIEISDAEWRDVCLLIIERLLEGERFDPAASPLSVADELACDGTLIGLAKPARTN